MTEFVTSKDGTRIAYDKLGQGPPLVIVNGALSVRTFVFARKTAKELAKSFTVYNYDRRGRGDSSDHAQYSVQKEVDDVTAVCKAAGGKPFVVGFSSGAALALEAAAAGVPMAGLYAYEPPYTRADPADKTDVDFRERLEAFRANGQRDEAVSYFMRTVGVPGFGVAIMKLLPMWKVMRGVAHTLPYDAAVMDGFRVPTNRLAAIKVPTVVANGAKTAPALKMAAKAAADAIPKAKHRVVPKSNHGIKPKAIAPELLATFKPS
ncbi:MAG: alpha/beta fold hydrolase [Thermoplasmatota archaeon]